MMAAMRLTHRLSPPMVRIALLCNSHAAFCAALKRKHDDACALGDSMAIAQGANLHQSWSAPRQRSLLQVEKHNGTIINIGSTAALRPVAAFPVYSAAKFGLRGWSLNCHEALRKHGVKVTLLNPGVCDSASLPALRSPDLQRHAEHACVAASKLRALRRPVDALVT